MVGYWNGLLRGVLGSPFLKVFQNHVDMVSGHGGDELTISLGDPRGLFQS